MDNIDPSEDAGLPHPDSQELNEILQRDEQRQLYKYLYETRSTPPSMLEIRAHMEKVRGSSHAQQDRRVRELRRWFDINSVRIDGEHKYQLAGVARIQDREITTISGKVRAEVLAPQRCAQCGKTPLDDNIRLQVDHKIPQSWGGTNEIENLQPLCEQCNHDKQAFYSTLDGHEEQIRRASSFEEPHKRIGELLKAFKEAGQEAPADVVGVVASMHQYQDDWQKRLRELRLIGWDYTFRKKKTDGRVRTYYTLTKTADWPEGNVKRAISDAEKRRKNNGA